MTGPVHRRSAAPAAPALNSYAPAQAKNCARSLEARHCFWCPELVPLYPRPTVARICCRGAPALPLRSFNSAGDMAGPLSRCLGRRRRLRGRDAAAGRSQGRPQGQIDHRCRAGWPGPPSVARTVSSRCTPHGGTGRGRWGWGMGGGS